MQDETALIRKSTDVTDDLEESSLQEVWIVQYAGSQLFDVFASANEAHKTHLRFKGSRVIYRKVL